MLPPIQVHFLYFLGYSLIYGIWAPFANEFRSVNLIYRENQMALVLVLLQVMEAQLLELKGVILGILFITSMFLFMVNLIVY